MAKQNQGFIQSFNLNESENDSLILNVLGGSGISDDIAIIQNNLRNTSTIAYNSISSGFFFFGNDNVFTFTNNDIVTVSEDVNVGSTILSANTEYYVCNSDAKTKFKLSTRPSTSNLGISTIIVSSVSPTNFNFIRKDYVTIDNIVNFLKPEILDFDNNFGFFDDKKIVEAFTDTQDRQDSAIDFIATKYSGISDLIGDKEVLIEGSLTINDPTKFNISSTRLTDSKSPGIYVGGVRAFSSSNNPWSKVGTTLSTLSQEVSVSELNFVNEITITGISTEINTNTNVQSFTHTIPITINNETYYLLLST